MPRTSFRRPILHTLRKTQAQAHPTVAKRPTDWKLDPDAEATPEAQRSSTRLRFYASHPPTYIHPKDPSARNTRSSPLRFYDRVSGTYTGVLDRGSIERRFLEPVVPQEDRAFTSWEQDRNASKKDRAREPVPKARYIRLTRTDAEAPLPSPTGKKRGLIGFTPCRIRIPSSGIRESTLDQTIRILRDDLRCAGLGDLCTTAQSRRFRTSAERGIMSDDAYAKFLEGANDAGATAQKTKSYGAKSVDTGVPEGLQSVEVYYVSDADEPFEPVSLKFAGRDVDADALKKLIGHNADVSSVSEKDFDPKGQYKTVLDAVKKAGDGKAKVFKVEHGSTRAEYYVVSVDEKEGRVVGLKALSVES